MLLELTDISKSYADAQTKVQALDGVSLQIDAGEFVAVKGSSGCGKSTLLLTAGGLLKPDTGTVQIDGNDPYSMNADERASFRAQNIGFVFQQFHLVPYLSVLDNILSPALAMGNSKSDATARAQKLVEQFGLTDRSKHVPAKLSSGERQRVAMARALLNEPKILLADEPTGNLDRANADALLGYLSNFASSGGAVLLVTHDDRAVDCAKNVVHLDGGKLATHTSA